MPELPEVETVRRGLHDLLVGRTFRDVEILDERLVRPFAPVDVAEQLTSQTVVDTFRRGKYLALVFESGGVALHHLRMTGSFSDPNQPVPSHVRMTYTLDTGGVVSYRDPRRFGTLLVDTREAVDAYLDQRLGPEPLSEEWTAEVLRESLGAKRCTLKAALLDQRVVAGLGNIYVDEACFLAGIRPNREAGGISLPRLRKLVEHVKDRLEESIKFGGSTLRDYRGVAGEVGGMQERFFVYGRAGKPCHVCGSTLRSGRYAGRTTVWCDKCQKP